MAKLIITLDGQLLREFELTKNRITIGRKPNNDIPLDNLAISREHAAITTSHNDAFVEDLKSTNGTLVNNQLITKHALHHGDEIKISKYSLKYVNVQELDSKVEPPEKWAQEFEKAMAQRSNQVPTLLPSEKPAREMTSHTISMVMPEAEESHAVVQILNGPNAGKELNLTKTLTSLGKPGIQVAVITRHHHGYFLNHVHGDRNPIVNGQALDAQPRQLADHDVIELAGVKMEFYLK